MGDNVMMRYAVMRNAVRFLSLLSKNLFYAYNPAFHLIKSNTK
jgi:hypothetical protein